LFNYKYTPQSSYAILYEYFYIIKKVDGDLSVNKIFSEDKVNIGRQPEVDMAKAVVIFFLASIHVFVECTSEEGLSSGIPYFFDSVLGGPWAAPMFIFSMGIGLAYSRHNTPSLIAKRGIGLLLLGVIHNTMRYLIPSLFGYAITGNRVFYIERLPYLFFGNDILQFAGIAMLLMALLRKINLSGLSIVIVSIVLNVVAMIFNNVNLGNPVLNILMGHFIGTVDGSVEEMIKSDFPLFIWFIMYAVGYLFGNALKRMRNKKKFYLIISIPCAIAVMIALPYEYFHEFGMMGGPADDVFYHANFFDMILCIANQFAMLGIYYLISRFLPVNVMDRISQVSKNVTIVYFIQWILVWWAVDFFLFIIKGSEYMEPLPALALGMALNFISVILADLWAKRISNRRMRRSVAT
jgi:Predicted membrane protein